MRSQAFAACASVPDSSNLGERGSPSTPLIKGGSDVPAKEYNTIFFRANNSYREKEYDAAIQDYEKLVNAGLESANIFYNLGNAYLRTGSKGKAILYYERALRMRPRDADIRSNLGYARTLVEGSTGEDSRSWYNKVFFFARSFLSMNEITFSISFLYFCAMVFIILSIILKFRKLLCYFAIAFFAVFIAILPSFISGVHEFESEEAVIMVREARVRFEPKDDAIVHFELYEGAVIQIIRSQEDWYQIKRYDGKMGWLKGDTFVII